MRLGSITRRPDDPDESHDWCLFSHDLPPAFPMSTAGPVGKKAWLWIASLGLALAFLGVDTAERVLRLHALTAYRVSEQDLPGPDPAGSTGWVADQHVLPLGYPDSYQWIRQTQDMVAEKHWRVRHTTNDNWPEGREVHWSSGLRWWLVGLAWCDHAITGQSLGRAIESVAPLAMPLSLAILLLVGTPWVARQFGPLAAALAGPIAVTCVPLYENFAAEAPDHHGWVSACGAATVLLLAAGGAGWVPCSPGPEAQAAGKRARRYFVLSGFAGAAGLWISAATQVPILVAIGIGAFCGTAPAESSAGDERPVAGLWRLWGIAGAIGSLGFYALEYFPAHPGLRLEINHPLYALAWAGAGDLVSRLVRWKGEGWRGARRELPGLSVDLAALAALPVCVGWWADHTFWVADRFLLAVHLDYIKEFKSIWFLARGLSWTKLLSVLNLLPLALVPLAILLPSRRIERRWRAGLWLAWLPAALVLILAAQQARWYGTACTLVLAAVIAGCGAATRSKSPLAWSRGRVAGAMLLALVVIVPYPASVMGDFWRTFHGKPEFSPDNLYELVARDVAWWLRARNGPGKVVVASDPTYTTSLIYFGGFHGLGTLYWENLPGLRVSMQLSAAGSPEAARAIVRGRGVNFLVVFPWQTFADEFARLAQGRRADQPTVVPAFLRDVLTAPEPPPWLKPLPYVTPAYDALKPLGPVRIFEVVPDQTPAEVLLRLAQYHLALDDRDAAAGEVLRAEAADPRYLPAHIFRARLAHGLGLTWDFDRELEAIRRDLVSQDATLALEDRIDLLAVLAVAGDHTDVVRELQLCIDQAEDRQLRRVRPDALFELGETIRRLRGDDPAGAAVVRRIETLVPRETRERLLFAYAVRFQREGDLCGAVAMYRRQLALDARAQSAMSNLAWILASAPDPALRDPDEALRLARTAVELGGFNEPFSLNALACACAAGGNFDEAVRRAQEALAIAERAGRSDLIAHLRLCLTLYQSRKPYLEPLHEGKMPEGGSSASR
jgi:tetratricopeptide (TPR) repeat protein